MTERSADLYSIISKFRTVVGISTITPFGSGHINDTYLVKNVNAYQPDYLLQRINHHVFKDVPGLMQNFKAVTTHIRQKLTESGAVDPDGHVLTLIDTQTNDSFVRDDKGDYWRMCLFIPGTRSYDMVTSAQQAYQGGRAFGNFQYMLLDFDPNILVETIPNFHNIITRLEKLDRAVIEDRFGRLASISDELAFIVDRAAAMSAITRLGIEGKLPLRVTHNDTKFNNVLLNQRDEAQCVIDLDTVMPGYVAFDFGDAARTIANTAAEDEADISKIQVNLPLLEAFIKGYLQETAAMLTPAEIDSLLTGALLLPYMQGVRFITDYLEGDHYFKTQFKTHNLQRARAQFALVSRLEENTEAINQMIATTALTMQQDRERVSMKQLKVPYFYGLNKNSSIEEISALLDQASREKIASVPWPDFDYKPEVGFAIGYAADCFFLKFFVTERHLQAIYNNINDPVHKDSCVELFIAFDNDEEYYNLEFNSVGACFAGYGKNRDERRTLPVPVIRKIEHQTLINGSTDDGISWELTLMIPDEVFCYHAIQSFKEKKCRVNLYKCGDDLPEPHFLAWNEVYSANPDFHLPQFFGNMQFV